MVVGVEGEARGVMVVMTVEAVAAEEHRRGLEADRWEVVATAASMAVAATEAAEAAAAVVVSLEG